MSKVVLGMVSVPASYTALPVEGRTDDDGHPFLVRPFAHGDRRVEIDERLYDRERHMIHAVALEAFDD